MQQSTLANQRRPSGSVTPRVRLLLLPAVIAGAVAAALLVFGGGGGDVVTVSSSGDYTVNKWIVPLSELPVADGEFGLEALGLMSRAAAGPLHQLIGTRGISKSGAEVLVSGYWWRVTESDDWTPSGILTQPIASLGLSYLLRQIPSAQKITDPNDLEMIWYVEYANESWPTESFSLEYDGIDGSRLSVELSSHNGGTMLKDAANQPNVTVTQLTPD